MADRESPGGREGAEADDARTQSGGQSNEDPLEDALDAAPHVDPDVAGQAKGLP